MPSNYSTELDKTLNNFIDGIIEVIRSKDVPVEESLAKVGTKAKTEIQALLEKAQKEAEDRVFEALLEGVRTGRIDMITINVDMLKTELNTGASENAQSKEG